MIKLEGRRQKKLMNELLFSSVGMRKNTTFAEMNMVLMSAVLKEDFCISVMTFEKLINMFCTYLEKRFSNDYPMLLLLCENYLLEIVIEQQVKRY